MQRNVLVRLRIGKSCLIPKSSGAAVNFYQRYSPSCTLITRIYRFNIMSKNPQALKRYHFCFRNLAIIAQLCNSLSLPALYSQSGSLHVFHSAELRIQFLWAKSASIHAPFFPATTKRTLDLFKYQKMGGIQSHKKNPLAIFISGVKVKPRRSTVTLGSIYLSFSALSIIIILWIDRFSLSWQLFPCPAPTLSIYLTMGGNDL